MEKNWWQSKTVWFGIAWAILGLLQVVLNFFGYANWQPGADLVSVMALVNAVVVILLRKVTSVPLA